MDPPLCYNLQSCISVHGDADKLVNLVSLFVVKGVRNFYWSCMKILLCREAVHKFLSYKNLIEEGVKFTQISG